MTKKTKKKARSKKDEQDERPDDGTAVYDETEDDEDWVEDEQAVSTTAPNDPAALIGTNQEVNPDEPVYGPPEDTIELPERDWSEPPLRPEDQAPEPYGYDISPNHFFNVKAQSMPEDRPDHDKPIADKGKDVDEYEQGETVQAVELEVRDDLGDDAKKRKQEQDRDRERYRDLDQEREQLRRGMER